MKNGSLTGWALRHTVLRRFFKVSLSKVESGLAEEALERKYAKSIRRSLGYSALMCPAVLLLDTSAVVSTLIPTTMVAGAAWFSVSLASMKQKFEDFGLELTTDLFIAFTLSLWLLFLTTAASLTGWLWEELIEPFRENELLVAGAASLAIFVVGYLLFSIFSGSLKYDINDAMLTGQNEAAERFFRRSLSVVYATSEELKKRHGIEVANYSIGLAFFEVFRNVSGFSSHSMQSSNGKLDLSGIKDLLTDPSMSQEEADKIAGKLTSQFLRACEKSIPDVSENHSYARICEELDRIQNNKESQELVDMRLSIILTEIANLIEEFGDQISVES